MLVAIQLSVLGLYLPPVFTWFEPLVDPPQTIISLPVLTAGAIRASGALVVLVGVQVSVPGLYLSPVFTAKAAPLVDPPQTIISLPVHTAANSTRASGSLAVAAQVSSMHPP